MGLDYVLLFAIAPESGCEINGLGDKSELAHRIMLVDLFCLLSTVGVKNANRQFIT